MIDASHDTVVGYGATAGGSLGLTVQWLTDFGSLAVILLNILLALGGLYLLYLRAAKARRDLAAARASPDGRQRLAPHD